MLTAGSVKRVRLFVHSCVRARARVCVSVYVRACVWDWVGMEA